MRLNLKQMILNVINDQPRGYVNILAEIAGYTGDNRGSNFKKVLTGEKKEFSDLGKIVDLVKYLFEKDEKKILEDYSRAINPNWKSARSMLEYLSCNRLLDSMKELIDRMFVSSNAISQEWAKVYSLQYKWQSDYYTMDKQSFINQINDTKTNISELKTYLNLLSLYGYYRQENYRMAYEISKGLSIEIEQIEDDFIKKMYRTKLNEVLSYIELRVLNNPDKSRIHSEEVIQENIGIPFTSYAYYSIGCSYLFSSYQKSLENLNKSIDLYKSFGREDVVKDIREKIDLLNVIWNQDIEMYNLSAKMISEAKKSRLSNGDIEKFKNEISIPFYFLIKGIKENNCDLLLQSVIHFLKIGDTFLSNLPRIELLNRNYSEDVLRALVSLNNAA